MKEQIRVLDRSFSSNDAFFEIECKRLPTPGYSREREYVVGNERPNGGIERFKKSIHGNDLSYSAIIGYIQEGDAGSWLSKVNKWINELMGFLPGFWKEEDKLIWDRDISTGLTKYHSRNLRTRIDEPDNYIILVHFWIYLVDN